MLVTVQNLCDYMDRKLPTARKEAAMEMILAGIQSEIEAYLRRPIEPGTFTDVFGYYDEDVLYAESPFYTTGDPAYSSSSVVLPLANTPVHSVTSVYINSLAASAVPEQLLHGQGYLTRSYGVEVFNGYPGGTVTVTYTAGLVPGLNGNEVNLFRLLILRAASRETQNLFDDNRGIADLEQGEVALGTTGLTEAEKLSIKRYRRQRI